MRPCSARCFLFLALDHAATIWTIFATWRVGLNGLSPLQGAKFDPDGGYVRRWVPEIGKLHNSLLHSPWEARPIELADAGIRLGRTYPAPIVDHDGARQRALVAFKCIKKT
jgi:FAD binding domain of DNA photolyase